MVAVAVLAVGCRGEGRDRVAVAVAAGVRTQLGVKVEGVRCAAERCEVTLAGGAALTVRVSGERDVAWETGELIRTAPIAALVRVELAELGVEGALDCGPALMAARPGEVTRVTCRFGTGGGAVWVDVAPDGGLALEVALDDHTVRTRTEEVDPEGLDGLSRSFDTDQAEGADDDDDAADAGVADAGVSVDAPDAR